MWIDSSTRLTLSAPERRVHFAHYYQNGLHELEPAFTPKFRLLYDQIKNDLVKKATKLEKPSELPDTINYNGHEYTKPDTTKGAKPSPNDYTMFDTDDGRYLAPRTVVDAIRKYDPANNFTPQPTSMLGKAGAALKGWMQRQILMGGLGLPHVFNMRRVAAESPLGIADRRGWAYRVMFDKELRARGIAGLNDPTFEKLVKNGGLAPAEVAQLKQYWGKNLNPLSWMEAALKPGHKLLFDPGSLKGFGGLDQRREFGSPTQSKNVAQSCRTLPSPGK